jgi:hypothetical protein
MLSIRLLDTIGVSCFHAQKTIYNIDAQKIGFGSASVNDLVCSTDGSHLKRKR